MESKAKEPLASIVESTTTNQNSMLTQATVSPNTKSGGGLATGQYISVPSDTQTSIHGSATLIKETHYD